MLRTVSEVFDETAKRVGHHPALRVKRGGRVEVMTWSGYRETTRKAARGLMALGLEAGRAISIVGFNSPEWVIADVGAILAGGRPAGIYTTSSPAQCRYIAHHSESQIVVAESGAQVKKIVEIRDQLPELKAIVQMTGKPEHDGVISWEELLKRGDDVAEAELDARIARQKPEDVCTLIYTSGTTGEPKAVMISHKNLTWSAATVIARLGFTEKERAVSYLPLSHIAEQILTIHGPMGMGSQVTFAPSVDGVLEAMAEVHPTYFLGVPRVWEKIEAKMKATAAASPRVRREILAWARGVGLRGGEARERGEPLPFLYPLANKLVFSKIKQRLGLDACRMPITGAAPISRSTLDFFRSVGIDIYEVYGMSECSGAATFSAPDSYRLGKAGFVVPGSEVRIAEDGEVCIRGHHVFAGYFKDEAATAATIDAEGWLHSGDIGTLEGGFLQITDRKKDLLITAGGENIAPQVLEGKLKSIPVVAQAVVVGDRKKYLAALLTLDVDRLTQEAEACGSPARDVAAAAACEIFKKHVEGLVEGVNRDLARVQTIKRISIIPSDFSVDSGELTPTMKVKRKVVNEKYKSLIEAMYVE